MKTIGLIGCGNMGTALVGGILGRRLIPRNRLRVWDADADKRRGIKKQFRLSSAESNREVMKADVVLLAVKPQQMGEVLKEIRPHLHARSLLISIAAGISTLWIEKQLGKKIPIVRVMPNTPALIGVGMSALTKGRYASKRHLKTAQQIFACVGQTARVPEGWMNAVTAVSGSGPAYFFYLMEKLMEEGKALGLSEALVRPLVLQTAKGAAELALKTQESPALLRARVTSKGGTTEAAFKVFHRKKLGGILAAGIRAAALRGKELGK